MYSAVLMLALTAGSESADFGRNRCHSCAATCSTTTVKCSTAASCSSSCHAECGDLAGATPRSSGGKSATASSNVACA